MRELILRRQRAGANRQYDFVCDHDLQIDAPIIAWGHALCVAAPPPLTRSTVAHLLRGRFSQNCNGAWLSFGYDYGGRIWQPTIEAGMTVELDLATVAKAYARWAPVYDVVFGALFNRGRQAAIVAAERVGGRILEVGVGTGISLPGYSSQTRIVGIDLSEPMLRKARERVAELSLDHVESLEVMDAEHLSFPDASFDVVVAHYVVSTVPHPETALDEFARTLKPGGEIVLVNRVGADAGLRRVIEQWLEPLVRRLGWRTAFPWGRFARWIERRGDVQLIERRAMPPFGHFSLLRFAKSEAIAS